MKTPNLSSAKRAFTLIELLVVIAIIAVLAGLAFPSYQSVQNAARKTQAKNDLVQIVTAVNAFYTDYGQYPCAASTDDSSDYVANDTSSQKALMDNLRANGGSANPRQIAFISPPYAKDTADPRGGLANDVFYDPWGNPYAVKIDSNYNNLLKNIYTNDTGAGPADLGFGAIAWSKGKDGVGGSGEKNSGPGRDDVISWQ